MIHYHQSGIFYSLAAGKYRPRILCTGELTWLQRTEFSKAISKVTCPQCMKKLINKKLVELTAGAQRCGLDLTGAVIVSRQPVHSGIAPDDVAE